MPSIILSDNGVSSGSAGLKSTAASDGALALQTTTAGGTATTAVSIDTSQNVTFTNAANLPNTFGFKNRIINGAMVIDQRNAGAAVSNTGYPVDRWNATNNTDGAFTFEQVEDAPADFYQSLKFTVTTADSSLSTTQYARVRQVIEANNVSDLNLGTANAKTFTVSFWVKSSSTGTFSCSILNSAYDYSYPVSYTINAANTWEYKTITIAGPTAGTWLTGTSGGLVLEFVLAAASNISGTSGVWAAARYEGVTGAINLMATLSATWQVTGVQLEKGSTATSFDYRPYGTELTLCQRYYETSYNYGVAVGSNNSNGRIILSGSSQASNLCLLSIPYKVSKRTNATATLYSQTGTAGTWDYERSGASTTNTPVAYEGGTQGTNVYINVGSAWVSCTTYGHFAVSAEL